MPLDLLQPVTNLGVAGFAILVIWWVYQDSQNRNDAKDEAFRTLEKEVRTEITTQLIASTSALRDNAKIMERVIERISRN